VKHKTMGALGGQTQNKGRHVGGKFPSHGIVRVLAIKRVEGDGVKNNGGGTINVGTGRLVNVKTESTVHETQGTSL